MTKEDIFQGFTPFQAKARDSGGSLELTIDSDAAKYEGLKHGDDVRVWIKKMPKKEPDE